MLLYRNDFCEGSNILIVCKICAIIFSEKMSVMGNLEKISTLNLKEHKTCWKYLTIDS